MNAPTLQPRRSKTQKAFSALFSFALIANFFSPALAYADPNFIVTQTITFDTPGSTSWTVPAGVNTITAEVWAAGGAGGSGLKTNNSNLSGLGGGGGGYTQEMITVNPGDTYSIVVGTGGQGDGQNGTASSFVGTGANLLTTGGFAGTSKTGTNLPQYPTAGGAGGIGNGGNNATNLGGGNGGTEGCDPNNCGGNARASGGGGAAASGAGGLGLGVGDTNGIAGESGATGGGAGGAAGWLGRDGTCTNGCGGSGPSQAGDGIFPGGGGGGSDVGPGGYGANGEVIVEVETPTAPTPVSQPPVSSSNVTLQLGQPFTPAYIGGAGAGSWQFVVANYTNWNPGNGYIGTDIGLHPATDPSADYFLSWTPPAVGTYQFYVARNGDSTYSVSNFAGPYTLTVTANGGSNPPPVATSSSISLILSVNPSTLSAGNSAAVSTSATSTAGALTQHGLEFSSDNVNWTNIGASNPPAGTSDNLSINLPFPTAGTFYVRAYASNDGGQTYLYTAPQTVIVSAAGGGTNPPPGGGTSTTSPSVTLSVNPTTLTAGTSTAVSSVATGQGLTEHGLELSNDNVNWTNVGASNPPTDGTDTLAIMLPFPTAGTFYVRAYVSNDNGATYIYTAPQTVTVTVSNGGGGNPPPTSSTALVDLSVGTTTVPLGGMVAISTSATTTTGTLTQHGIETCLVGGNCPANVSSGNWVNVGASNPPTSPNDVLSITPAFNGVGTYDIRAYASNDGGQTYAYSNVDTVVVTNTGGGGNPPNPTHVLQVLPQGPGSVTSVPAGISCSSSSGCSAVFSTGTSIVLTATPNAGDFFNTWGDACASQGATSTCSLVMNSDMVVSATFSATSSPSVTLSVNPTTLTAGTSTAVSSVATGQGLTEHGLELSNDNVNWTNVGASNPPTDGTDTLAIMLPFPTAGTFYVRAYVSNDNGATYIYTAPQTVMVNAAGGSTPPGGGSGGGGGSSGGSSSGGGGGSHFYSNSPIPVTGTTTVTTTTVANAQANVPAVPVVGPSVCKAGDYITAFMKQGINNDPAEVEKLQNFLNEYEGANLDVNGTFDASTTAAVMAFQVKYAKDVLSPWGITAPTGIVYITTAHEINNIFCSLNPDYVGGPSATTTTQFNGAVGFSTSTPTFSSNIAGVIGAIGQNVKDFLKDILWYPLLILLLLGTGIWLILRYIFLKDKKDIHKQHVFIYGIELFAGASVLNAANTLLYLLTPVTFMERTNMTVGLVLGLDFINIAALFVAVISALYMHEGTISKRIIYLAPNP